MGAVRGAGGDERRDRAGLGDPLLEDLAVLVLLVEHQLLGVLGLVELADRRVDPDLAEHALHPERARLVGDDRDDVAADLLVAQQRGEHPDERHRGRDLALAGPLSWEGNSSQRRHRQRLGAAPADRQRAAERGAALAQVLHLGRVLGRLVVLGGADLLVGERQLEAVAEREQRVLGHLLGLVGDHLALAGDAHPVALDRLGEDHRRLAGVPDRRVVGRVDLLLIEAAAVEQPDLLVGHVRDALEQHRVAAEEVLAHVRAVARLERLVLAVDALLHHLARGGRRCRRPAAGPSASPRSP